LVPIIIAICLSCCYLPFLFEPGAPGSRRSGRAGSPIAQDFKHFSKNGWSRTATCRFGSISLTGDLLWRRGQNALTMKAIADRGLQEYYADLAASPWPASSAEISNSAITKKAAVADHAGSSRREGGSGRTSPRDFFGSNDLMAAHFNER
jgi:hypothetical protein